MADIRKWYNEMPKPLQSSRFSGTLSGNTTITGRDQKLHNFFANEQCVNCNQSCRGQGLCSTCLQDKDTTSYILSVGLQEITKRLADLNVICQSCTGSDSDGLLCIDYQCPIFYERKKVELECRDKIPQIQHLLSQLAL